MNAYDVQVAAQIKLLHQHGLIVRIPKSGQVQFFKKPPKREPSPRIS